MVSKSWFEIHNQAKVKLRWTWGENEVKMSCSWGKRGIDWGKMGVAEYRSPTKLEPPFGNHHWQTLGCFVEPHSLGWATEGSLPFVHNSFLFAILGEFVRDLWLSVRRSVWGPLNANSRGNPSLCWLGVKRHKNCEQTSCEETGL